MPDPVYTTWNPSDKASGVTLSNGNLTASEVGGYGGVRTVASKSSGKWYWEITINAGTLSSGRLGVATSTCYIESGPGDNDYGWGLGNTGYRYHGGSSASISGGSWTNGDIISIALDMDNNKIWWRKNGTWLGGGDPFTGAGSYYVLDLSPLFCMIYATSINLTANFGASAFTYAVPTGFAIGLGDNIPIQEPESQQYEESIDESAVVNDILADNFETMEEEINVNDSFADNIDTVLEGATSSDYLEAFYTSALMEISSVNAAITCTKGDFRSIAEGATASEVLTFNVRENVTLSENATSSVSFTVISSYNGTLETTTPIFTGTGTTGIGSRLSVTFGMPTLEMVAGFNIAVNTPFPTILATGGPAPTASLSSEFPVFSIDSHGVPYVGVVFEGVSPMFIVSSTGQIVPTANLDADMMMFVLNTSVKQSKDFVSDILWYDKEGIVGYLQQPQMEYAISGSAS